MSDYPDPCRVFEVDYDEELEEYEKKVARGALKTRLWLIASRLQQRRWRGRRLKSWPQDPDQTEGERNKG